MDHDAFIFTFSKMVKIAMSADETSEYAKRSLLFCAKFVTSFNTEETHPVLVDIFNMLLSVCYD